MLLPALLLLAAARPARAEVLVRSAFYSSRSDRISVLDARPQPHGEIGARLETLVLLTPSWAVGLGVETGGGRYDFGGPLVSGTGSDWGWSGWLAVDRLRRSERKSWSYLGVQVVYGETGSKLRNEQYYYGSQDLRGPANFLMGGGMRAGMAMSVWGPLEAWAEVGMRVYRGRGRQPISTVSYRWVGQSESMAVGLQVRLGRDRQAGEGLSTRDR